MSSACYTQQMQTGTQQYFVPGAPCAFNYSTVQGFQPIYNNGYAYSSSQFYGGTSMPTPQCSGGQTVVYSQVKGLGCVTNQQLGLSGAPAVYDLNQMTRTFVLVSQPNPYGAYQMGQMGGYNSSGFYGSMIVQQPYTSGIQVLRTCDNNDKCGPGLSCRSPLGPQLATGLGVCYH